VGPHRWAAPRGTQRAAASHPWPLRPHLARPRRETRLCRTTTTTTTPHHTPPPAHPAAYALGFIDCDNISARCMLTIFQFFATKTDASVLRMLNGSPAERLLKPITDYVEAKGGRIHLRSGCK
jgi:hypothetical protein